MRHGVLRNLVKVAFLLLAVWAFAFLLSSMTLSILEAVLWLHLAVIPFRMVFHLYCWYQEYDADRYAFDKVGKKMAKVAMRNLAESEIPYTKLFALVYREHPTAADRSYRILNK
jgi:Zn-dependent protease with chaperone function